MRVPGSVPDAPAHQQLSAGHPLARVGRRTAHPVARVAVHVEHAARHPDPRLVPDAALHHDRAFGQSGADAVDAAQVALEADQP